jgi:hypothetical protein
MSTLQGETRELLMREFGPGNGDVNALAHAIFQSDGTRAAKAVVLDGEPVLDMRSVI